MSIVSISLNEKALGELDAVTDELAIGRSEAVRSGIKLLAEQAKSSMPLKGIVTATLTVVYKESHADLDEVIHEHQKCIVTHLHHHLEATCIDLFILKGDAARIKALVQAVQHNKKLDHLKLVLC